MGGHEGKAERSADGLSRRQILTGGAAAVGATGLLTGGALAGAMGQPSLSLPKEDPFGPSVNGTIVELRLPNELVLGDINLGVPADGGEGERPGGAAVLVKLAPDALLMRIGPAQLSDFRPGEKVIAYGPRWEGDEFSATSLTPLLQAMEAEVSDARPGRISTSQGTLVLRDGTRFRPSEDGPGVRSVADIQRGQQIHASFIENPASGELEAQAIGVVGT